MSYQEYVASREAVSAIGQLLITVIVIISLSLGLTSLYHILSNHPRAYGLADGLRKCVTLLLFMGFFIIMWFHLRIYQTIELVIPGGLSDYLVMTAGGSVSTMRPAVPLWIETEKLYFWTLCISIFLTISHIRYDFLKTRMTALFSSCLNIMLAVFAALVYETSDPFRPPLPGLHSEITAWHQAGTIGDPYTQYQALIQMYFRLTYYYNSEYMWTHPPMLFIAYASFVITFMGCIFMLFSKKKIFDSISYSHARAGYLLLTAGILIGYPWALVAWEGKPWWWDPKINGSIMMWVLYSAYLHSRIYLKRRTMWRATAILGILGFFTLVFTYLLTYIAPGIHAIPQ